MMKKDRREQSEMFSEQDRRYVVIITELILILFFFFKRINHMALKTICIDPLSKCCCTSFREQLHNAVKELLVRS